MLDFGMPAGFGAALAQKYALLGLTANANANEANARTGLINTQNTLLPGTTAADVAKTNAETGQIGETTKYIGPLAQSQIGVNTSTIGKTNAETTGLGIQNDVQGKLAKSNFSGLFSGSQFPSLSRGLPDLGL